MTIAQQAFAGPDTGYGPGRFELRLNSLEYDDGQVTSKVVVAQTSTNLGGFTYEVRFLVNGTEVASGGRPSSPGFRTDDTFTAAASRGDTVEAVVISTWEEEPEELARVSATIPELSDVVLLDINAPSSVEVGESFRPTVSVGCNSDICRGMVEGTLTAGGGGVSLVSEELEMGPGDKLTVGPAGEDGSGISDPSSWDVGGSGDLDVVFNEPGVYALTWTVSGQTQTVQVSATSPDHDGSIGDGDTSGGSDSGDDTTDDSTDGSGGDQTTDGGGEETPSPSLSQRFESVTGRKPTDPLVLGATAAGIGVVLLGGGGD